MEAKTGRSKAGGTAKCEPGRRERQDIIMGILRTSKTGSTKYDIIKKVTLSSAQCSEYLKNLKEAGYISEESGTWKTTERGLQVIDACRICHNLMNVTQKAESNLLWP